MSVQTLIQQLKEQYQLVNQNSGYSYRYPDRLDRLFEEQAKALEKAGISNIYDVGVGTIEKDVPISVIQRPIYDSNDNFTGQFEYLKPVGVQGYGESEVLTYGPLTPSELANVKQSGNEETGFQVTTTTKVPAKILINKQTGEPLKTGFREESELREFNGVDIWGGANLGKGLDLFSIQVAPDGSPIFVPVWQETSDKDTIAKIATMLAAAYFGPTLAGGSAGAAADAAFVAADAAQLAAQGLNQAAITQNLLATGVSQATAQTAATMALSGASESAIANQLGRGSLFNNAPIETRNLADYPSATETAYPAVPVEQTYTPAPGSFQEALPGLGVETQASQAPFTAAPGSFGAAVSPTATAAGYGLLSQPPSTISIQDALRAANTANQLLNPPDQPVMPMDQGGGGMRAQGVDYSGLLGLLQARASTLGVSGLLAPAQIRYPSLLG